MFPRDTILADIFNELSATVMAIKLESDKRVVWQDKQFTKNWIDPLTYRLLESSVEIENVHNGNFLAECCRLGALILLSKIRRCFNVDTTRLVFTGQETANLRFLLSSYADQWTMFQPMLLWVSFLGALEVEGEEKVWFCDLIKTTSQQLMIQEWDEILVSASNLLWVGKVLDMECEMLKPLIENNTD
jgi:hypothetical protein